MTDIPPIGTPWWLVRDGRILYQGRITTPPPDLPGPPPHPDATAAVIRGTFAVEVGDVIYCDENPRWAREFTDAHIGACIDGTMTIVFDSWEDRDE